MSANRGSAGLAGIGLSVAATFTVAVAGPSVMEPALPGRPGQPPWAFSLELSPYLAVGLTAIGLAAGATGLLLVLRAIRDGWSVSARAVLLAGIVAATALCLVPPFGSSDPLSYAAYGRMVATGHNPYLTTPSQLAELGDPVARAVQDWFHQPSVYGPLASGIQGLASLIGGTSARLTVFVLGLVNLLAFVATGLLLNRMTKGRPDRQLRAALLWTANPLLLQVLVAGAHVDVQQIACCVAAVAVMHRISDATPARAALAGALVGAGFAIKVTAALVGLGLAIALVVVARGAWRRVAPSLAALAAGFAAVAGTAAGIGGSAMLKTTSQASDMVSIGSPWRAIRTVSQHAIGHGAATSIVKYGAIVLAVVLAVLITWAMGSRAAGSLAVASRAMGSRARGAWGDGIPPDGGSPGGRPPGVILALVVGWLFAWPYVLPWYDALGWALLALVPASGLDWLLLARTTALGFAYLPARTVVSNLPRTIDLALPHGLSWVQPVFRNAVSPIVLTVTTVWLLMLLWRMGKKRGVATTDEVARREHV